MRGDLPIDVQQFETEERPGPARDGPRLLDLASMVVGYSLAALALKMLWPAGVPLRPPVLIVMLLGYAWLGLAMSGPFVLLRRPAAPDNTPRDAAGRTRRATIGQPLTMPVTPPARFTRAEAAWLLIGAYWIAAMVLVIPTRMPVRSAPILGVIPVIAALVMWLLGPRRTVPNPNNPTWTHHLAVTLLATWPFAWVALILLTVTFG